DALNARARPRGEQATGPCCSPGLHRTRKRRTGSPRIPTDGGLADDCLAATPSTENTNRRARSTLQDAIGHRRPRCSSGLERVATGADNSAASPLCPERLDPEGRLVPQRRALVLGSVIITWRPS